VAIFPAPAATLEGVLKGHHTAISRLDFLESDYNAIRHSIDGQLLGGSVNQAIASDTFSSASVSVLNEDGVLDPVSIDGHVWPDRPVRVSRGALVEGAPELKAQITGIITDPQDAVSSGEVGFTIASRFALAKRFFPTPTTIPASMSGEDAIRTLAELGGLGTSDALYDLDAGGFTVTVPRTFAVNEEILGSMVKWAFDFGCELWPNGAGVTTMRPYVSIAASAWTLDEELLSLKRVVRSRRSFNRQTVYGRGPDGYTIKGEAIITDPTDPFFWRPDFDLPAKDYSSVNITTHAAAVAMAERLLAEAGGYEEAFDIEAWPIPLLSARDFVGLRGRSGVSRLDSLAMPIYHGAMRGQTRRLRTI
jgi:hypothetical protein